MMTSPTDLVQDVVRRARRAGAEEAEAYYQDLQKTRIELRNQKVESLASAATRGIGLRVLVDGAGSYVYTSDPRPRRLAELARRAVALAREAARDPDRTLPELVTPPIEEGLEIYDPALSQASPERKIELLRQVEREARE